MKNLLSGNGRLLEQSGQARQASVLQNRSREVQSAEIRKDQSILDKGRSFLQRRSAAQIADQNAGIEVRQILQGAPGPEHQIVDHGSHGAAFEHRIAREFGIFVGPSCLYPTKMPNSRAMHLRWAELPLPTPRFESADPRARGSI